MLFLCRSEYARFGKSIMKRRIGFAVLNAMLLCQLKIRIKKIKTKHNKFESLPRNMAQYILDYKSRDKIDKENVRSPSYVTFGRHYVQMLRYNNDAKETVSNSVFYNNLFQQTDKLSNK